MMLPKVVLVSLLSLVLVLSAAGLECRIYVSSSDGINNTSCWTGGLQTPCATIDLAIQGTPTLQYNCSSGILINLSPGTYTLDTTSLLEQQALRNNVSIIGTRDGSRYEEVSITCLHVSSSSYNWLRYIVFQCVSLYNCNNVPVTCTEPSFDLTTHNQLAQEICNNLTLNVKFINLPLQCSDNDHYDGAYQCNYPYHYQYCQCQYPRFKISITDNCNMKTYNWKNDLKLCVSHSHCCNASIQYEPSNSYQYYYQLDICFDDYFEAGPIVITVYIETLGLISINTTVTVNVSATCGSDYQLVNGECIDTNIQICNDTFKYNLPFTYYNDDYHDKECSFCFGECCYDDSTEQCLSICTSDTGVPINNLTCINCTQYSKYGIILFIGLELIPMTLMVIVIIIFNIQLTNGSINAVVFYSQLIAIIQSIYGLTSPDGIFSTTLRHFSAITCYIFNLDFTPFLFNYIPLCISDHMSPLGAISFWYVIGFYPLLLLLLLYIWITLYHKGCKCVVFITRPFHRCMARFWSMTGIEPSFTHSIASIYILCFTQLTATSFKILSFNSLHHTKFSFNEKQEYFHKWHGLAGLIAIIVLLFLIILPTLCILFYQFKWFQKLLDCLHLRKPLLITLADVFTGPYKNGTKNTFDYRFMAGLYLLARIIILSQFLFGFQYFVLAVPIAMSICSFLLAGVILIFRTFYRNIHNFTEYFTLLVIGVLTSLVLATYFFALVFMMPSFNILVFGMIIPIYIMYKLLKIIKACHYYHKKRVPVVPTEQEYEEEIVDDWVADRMENPQEYDEQHVPVIPDDPLAENEELRRPLLDIQN